MFTPTSHDQMSCKTIVSFIGAKCQVNQ
jgi:hypothetical protein